MQTVLHDLTFSVDKGAYVSVLGPNGIGKSTLFQCILRILSNYTGDIFLEQVNIRTLHPREMAAKIAYIPQAHSSVFNYSVLEMVLMGTTSQFSSFTSPAKEQVELSMNVMDMVGISCLKDRGFQQLSGGEQQLVFIARALAQQADILIMDEPTSNLDYGNQIKVLSLLRKLSDQGYTILQSTHNPDHALAFSDSVLALWNGSLLSQGSPKSVITSELIQTLYGIHADIFTLKNDTVQVCIPQILP